MQPSLFHIRLPQRTPGQSTGECILTVIMELLQAIFLPSWLSILAGILLVFVAAATSLYERLRRRRYTKPFDDLPVPSCPEKCHWFFGHLPYLIPDFIQAQQWVSLESANAQGRTGYWHAQSRAISITHWQDVRQVLMAEDYREPVKILSKHMKQLLGNQNLLIMHGKVWKYHRSAVAKAFTPARLASYKGAMVQVVETMCESLLKKIQEEELSYYKTEIEPLMKMITMDVFGLAAFSYDFGSTKTITPSPFATAFESLATGMTTRFNTNPLRPSNYFYSFPTELNRQHSRAKKLLRQFLVDQVRQRQAGLGNDADGKKDLLAYMVDAHESSGEKDSATTCAGDADEVLTDLMMTLLGAGYDTTSITLTYALYLVSHDPQVYARCLQEIDACSDLVTTDGLQYCHAVVREALRLYPSAPVTLRSTRKELVLWDGFVVPKGTMIYIPIWTIHRLQQNFDRAEEFVPERWVAKGSNGKWTERNLSSGEDNIPAANMQAFFAFSGGARNCPGARFALQEATIVLAGLLKHLRFDALPNYTLSPGKIGLVQHPNDSLPMKISRREKHVRV